MEMYHFRTEWHVRAPVERAWQTVVDAERWPEWGKGFRRVTVRGPETRLHPEAVVDAEVRGALPYTLRFTFVVDRFEPPHVLTIRPTGDLVGEGKWEIAPAGDGSDVVYHWDVGLTNRFMDALSRLSLTKRLLAWNHDHVMNEAFQGFRRQTELVGRR